VESAGGVPILIPLLGDLSGLTTLLPRLDGLLLSGGIDIQPKHYGEEPHALLGEVEPRLDELELALAHWAIKEDIPTLGICRGMQMMNVALGGTLYQDLSDQVPGSLRHPNWDLPRNTLAHSVRIEAGSAMERIMGRSEVWANSLHHQAVKVPGKGARISGRAEDGVAELLEVPGRRFMMAAQCHPEELYKDERVWGNLFSAFVDACVHPVVRTLTKVEQSMSAEAGVI
jgi:putative glutamine amidotransferase